jgi:hypothetical protein
MTTIHIDTVELLAIVGKCRQIKESAIDLKGTGHDQDLLEIEQLLDAIIDVVIEAAKAEFGKVER